MDYLSNKNLLGSSRCGLPFRDCSAKDFRQWYVPTMRWVCHADDGLVRQRSQSVDFDLRMSCNAMYTTIHVAALTPDLQVYR